ncbi:MAG TPA: hypothetical protein VNR18_03100, partial [Hyphomicrobiales bacterium]|nr:hypothetical protein [Hyphomicrobiales bacterium]
QNLARMRVGLKASFYPDGGARESVPLELSSIEGFTVDALDELYAASTYGGGLQVRDGPNATLSPLMASYRLHFTSLADTLPERVLRGTIRVDTEALSPLRRYWRHALSVWRREAGF